MFFECVNIDMSLTFYIFTFCKLFFLYICFKIICCLYFEYRVEMGLADFIVDLLLLNYKSLL